MHPIVLFGSFLLINAALGWLLWRRYGERVRFDELQRALPSVMQRIEGSSSRIRQHIEREQRLVRELASIATDSPDQSLLAAKVSGSIEDLKLLIEYLGDLTSTMGLLQKQFRLAQRRDDSPPLIEIEAIHRSSPKQDQRKHERKASSFPVSVLPLGENLRPIGQPIEGMATEVSTGGMSFCHVQRLTTENLALHLTPRHGDEIFLIFQRKHTENYQPFFVSGGKFVERIHTGTLIDKLREFQQRRNAVQDV